MREARFVISFRQLCLRHAPSNPQAPRADRVKPEWKPPEQQVHGFEIQAKVGICYSGLHFSDLGCVHIRTGRHPHPALCCSSASMPRYVQLALYCASPRAARNSTRADLNSNRETLKCRCAGLQEVQESQCRPCLVECCGVRLQLAEPTNVDDSSLAWSSHSSP